MAEDLLCVFVKPPRPGEVKTRLVPAVGEAGAAALARAFFEDTWAVASRLEWARPVVAAAGELAGTLGLPPAAEVWPQGGGDLGERLERVLRRALVHGGRAIAIGTDSPGLPPQFLAAAREALATHDAVLGPADDGGFYLLGVRRCPEGLLAGLPWSHPETLTRTAERLEERGLSLARLEPWFDVDEPEDLERLRDMLRRGAIQAPATARLLESLPAGAVR